MRTRSIPMQASHIYAPRIETCQAGNADPGIERAEPVSGRMSRRIARFAAFGAAHGLPLTHIVKSVAFLIVGCVAIGLTGDAYAQAERTSFSAVRPYSPTDRFHDDTFALPG